MSGEPLLGLFEEAWANIGVCIGFVGPMQMRQSTLCSTTGSGPCVLLVLLSIFAGPNVWLTDFKDLQLGKSVA